MFQQYNIRKYSGIALMIVVALFYLTNMNRFSIDSIVDYTSRSIPIALISFLVLYFIKATVMVIPISALYVSAAIALPLPYAFFITYAGLVVALSVGYLHGKQMGKEKAEELVHRFPKVEKTLEKRRHNLPFLCFFSRLSPIPFDLFSLFSGAMDIPFGKYLLFSLLGTSIKLIPIILTTAMIL